MKLTCKFVKSILPKKVHKYICKDYDGCKLEVWINLGFCDITEELRKQCLNILKENNITIYKANRCQEFGYFLRKIE